MTSNRAARAFAGIGAALFAGSLLLCGVRYVGAFGALVTGPPLPPALVDAGLFTIFALHHSLFARFGLKQLITRAVPPALERSVYVWVASLLFAGVIAYWRPVYGLTWNIDGGARWLLYAVQLAGVWLTIVSATRLDVFELAGLRQATGRASDREPHLISTGLYAFVRHPIYFAWLLMVWPAPFMTGTRLVFAAVSTLYLCLAIPFEERDLRRTFGPAYDAYATRVRARLLPFIY